jgi:hypothetical protein
MDIFEWCAKWNTAGLPWFTGFGSFFSNFSPSHRLPTVPADISVQPPAAMFSLSRTNILLLSSVTLADAAPAVDYDESSFLRAAPGQLERELKLQNSPQIPFKVFSSAYVAKALKENLDWTEKGAGQLSIAAPF